MIKWFAGINVFLLVAYIQVLAINEHFDKKKYERTHFPCQYVQGVCTVKVSWKNCSGGMPYDYCEKKINGFL
jgi:hypothetical protein|tara:strand:+ start:934 stop:1149 length:216 start_codon:yes stop_codon:yes gene_type:complete